MNNGPTITRSITILLTTLAIYFAVASAGASTQETWGMPTSGPDLSPDGCGSWLAARADPEQRSLKDLMAAGYLGLIVIYADKVNMTDPKWDNATVNMWLDDFCHSRPNEKVETGLAALAVRLARTGAIQ